MSKLHISIPELDARKLSYEEFFRVMIILVDHESKHLKNLHQSTSINDLQAYPLQIICRIVEAACTLHSVIERDNDYVIANVIVRSLADFISAFSLIYIETEGEERILRHYLYIIDGLQGRLQQFPQHLKNNGRLTSMEYNGLLKQINDAKINYQRAYESSVREIKKLTIYNGYKSAIDGLVKHANWRYKSLASMNVYKNRYNWNELYPFLNMGNVSGFFSTLSEFVHGLSTSNLLYEKTTEDFEPIYGVATSLIGKLQSMLSKLYATDLEILSPKLISALLDEGMPQQYVNDLIMRFLSKETNE